MQSKNVIILKNDAVGDLVHSLKAINNIIQDKEVNKITIFLSNLSKKFSFLFNDSKIDIKILNYNLSIFEKIKLFYFILVSRVDKVFILAPKKYYYFLPIFFIRTKFYAVCINNINNYKRPPNFLRKFLFKYVINDRSAVFKRDSTSNIQEKLTSIENLKKNNLKINTNISNELKSNLPKDFIYFHAKRKILNELGWGINELKFLFKELLNNCENIVLTKDIEKDKNTTIFKDNFNSFDFTTKKFNDKSQKIIFFDNIDGEDLYNTIRLSKKVIAFHGMMTNLASVNNKPVLDLFHCKIKNWNDYRNYRNSFYEFKPKYVGYDFIIPKKDIRKTIKKMKFSLKK